MKTMWEFENGWVPLYCFRIETNTYFYYIMANNEEVAEQYFRTYSFEENPQKIVLHDDFEEEKKTMSTVKLIDQSSELHTKRFFLGESGFEDCEEDWYSLYDLILLEQEEFEEVNYAFEHPTNPYLLTYTKKPR